MILERGSSDLRPTHSKLPSIFDVFVRLFLQVPWRYSAKRRFILGFSNLLDPYCEISAQLVASASVVYL